MTGSLSGALKGAMWGAISAGMAFGIGGELGHAGGIFTKGVTAGKAFIKAAAHGLSRGIISVAQGGTFKAGFASGFSASFFSPGTTMGGDGAGGFGLRTSIASIVGGTASSIGGGKFSNGAVSGAFVHMFNAEAKAFIKGGLTESMKEKAKYYTNEAREARGLIIHNQLQTYRKPLMAAGVTGLVATIGAVTIAPLAVTAIISYPLEIAYGTAIVNDFYNESLPPVTLPGQVYYMMTHTQNLP